MVRSSFKSVVKTQLAGFTTLLDFDTKTVLLTF